MLNALAEELSRELSYNPDHANTVENMYALLVTSVKKIQERTDDNIKRISIQEFRDFGFLQEANRLFFHPLGLALEVIMSDPSSEDHDPTMNESTAVVISGVWDYRDDPEGMLFGKDMIDLAKVERVEALKASKLEARKATGDCYDDGTQIVVL